MATILLTATIALAAVVCLLLWLTVRTLRHLAERSIRPWLVLDIDTDAAGIPAVTVTNVGSGPALDAELTVAFDEHDPDPHTTQGPPGLPQRFHAARVVAPGGQVRFPPPGNPSTGHLAPAALAAWVRAIELTGTATDLDGRPVAIHDRLDDLFRRVEAIRTTSAVDGDPPAVGWPLPAERHASQRLTAR
jgi:hypothetical protein